MDSSVERIFVAITEECAPDQAVGSREGADRGGHARAGICAGHDLGVKEAGVTGAILIIMADLPLVTADLIDEIIEVYADRPEPALSTHTPLELHARLGRRPDSLFNYQGQLIVPAGINILEGSDIENEQEDYHLILERIELAVNVNVADDLMLCEKLILE